MSRTHNFKAYTCIYPRAVIVVWQIDVESKKLAGVSCIVGILMKKNKIKQCVKRLFILQTGYCKILFKPFLSHV